MSHISWRNTTTPTALEMNPKDLYDRLFGGRSLKAPSWDKEAKAATDKPGAAKRSGDDVIGTSILDQVREDARRLMAGVGANDRTKLEGYLDGIRAIERRLDHAEDESTEPRRRQRQGAERGSMVSQGRPRRGAARSG